MLNRGNNRLRKTWAFSNTSTGQEKGAVCVTVKRAQSSRSSGLFLRKASA